MFFLNSLYNLLEKITEYALNELYNEKEIKRKIMELAVLYELNEIDEDEYDRLEKKLLAQLREAREYNKRREEEEGEEEEDREGEGEEGGEGEKEADRDGYNAGMETEETPGANSGKSEVNGNE